jgi:hypothetical protein
MLSDDKQATAYAHVCTAIDDWDALLNTIWDALLPEDEHIVKSIGDQLHKAKEVLDVD